MKAEMTFDWNVSFEINFWKFDEIKFQKIILELWKVIIEIGLWSF